MPGLALLVGACAALYASVGFGGGSAYLAILALLGFERSVVVPLTLALNVVVVSGGAWHFARAGHFRPRLLLPFLVTSIPAAFAGARLPVSATAWKHTAAALLLLSATLLVLRRRRTDGTDAAALDARLLWRAGPPCGALLGLASGVVGLGGGVFLAPLLHLLGWGRTKQIAAASSTFILLNSLSGLAGHASAVAIAANATLWLALVTAVLLGGQLGSRLGAYHVAPAAVRAATAAVLGFAGTRLFLTTPLGERSGISTLDLLLALALMGTLMAATGARAALRRRAHPHRVLPDMPVAARPSRP